MEFTTENYDVLGDDAVLNGITKQLREMLEDCDTLEKDIHIYTDRKDQKFKIPAFYVYLANVLTTKGLRNSLFLNEANNYSYFIVYKNSQDKMIQSDALQMYTRIKRAFRYLKLDKYTIHMNEIEMDFNNLSMIVTLRFIVPTRVLYDLELVKNLEVKEKIKYGDR